MGGLCASQTCWKRRGRCSRGEPPPHLEYRDRYAVRSGACVTGKTKDLAAVMIERFGDPAGFVGPPKVAAAE
jgi:hypothetical protein